METLKMPLIETFYRYLVSSGPVLIIAEGYATAASLSEALGQGTVAAFDSGNLPHIARALH
jgi:phage/plasmid primase-like uncharacterized protein